jgi:predicted neutral ceramidase superfamily lipid hydrolase
MAIIFRILLVIVGYILACVAASIVLTIGTLTPQWDDLSSLGLPSAILWSVVGVGAAFIAAIAAPPALLVIALAEGFALRSGLVYAVLGAVLALSLSYGLDFAGYVGEPGGSLAREREVIVAAGIAGGFIYWLLAGRGAGSWK